MFKSRDQIDHVGDGAEGGEETLSRAMPAQAPSAASTQPSPHIRILQYAAELRHKVESRCNNVDLAPDLAQDIGSARWFRGLATMLGLTVAAVSFWPDFTAVEAATAMPVDPEARDEFRSQMIMPLAFGGDSGRHMGATTAVLPLKSAPERPQIELVATLGPGDSFSRMMQRAGVGRTDAVKVADLIAAVMPLDDVESGTQFDIVLGKRAAVGEPRPLDRLGFRARFDLDLAIARHGGNLSLERHPITVDSTPLRITGSVGNSLYRSARDAGAPLQAIKEYLRTIDEHLNIKRDIASGDEFDIIIAYKRSAKGERQAGKLLYAGLARAGKPRLQLMRWGDEGRFFEASGVGKRRTTNFRPVAGRMTSRYGMRRHPILGYKRMHSGVDYGARHGTPIYAVSDGVVTYAGRHGGHGKYVRLKHSDGLSTGYAHMSRIAVSSGTRVRAGQVIGYVGSTGLSTGPHLHFEVYRGKRTINPLSVQFVSRAQLSGKELADFKKRLAALKAVPPGAALANIAPDEPVNVKPEREIDKLSAHRKVEPALSRGSETRSFAARQDISGLRD